jgi:hypothetical protein
MPDPRTALLIAGLLSIGCPGEPSSSSATTGGPDTTTSAGTTGTTEDPTGSTPTTTGATTGGATTSTSDDTGSSSGAGTTGATGTTGADGHAAWVLPLSGPGTDQLHGIAVTAQGDIVVGGLFLGTTTLADQMWTSLGGYDLLVAKLGRDGTLQWGHRIGGAGAEHGAAVGADAEGNVLFAGEFSGAIELPGGTPLQSQGAADLLLAKFSPDGALVWARSFGGPGSEFEPKLAIDASGDVVIAAVFEQTIDFGGAPLVAVDAQDIAVAKLDGDGAHVWSKAFGGGAGDGMSDLAIDGDGDLALTGWFANDLDFGGGPLLGGGVYVAVLAGDDGSHVWSRAAGNGDNNGGCAVGFAGDGSLLVTGYFRGSVDFGGGPIAAVDETDAFVATYAADGAPLWARGYGGELYDGGCGVAAGHADDWIVGGHYAKEIDLGGGKLVKEQPSAGYLASLARGDAAHRWSLRVYAHPSARVDRLAAYPDGDVVVVGSFAGTLELFEQQHASEEVDAFVAYFPRALLEGQ